MNKIHAIFIVSFLMQIVFLTNMYASQRLSFDFDYVTQNAEEKTKYYATLESTFFNLKPPIDLNNAIMVLSYIIEHPESSNRFLLSCFARKLFIWKTQGITFKQILENINTAIQFKKNHPLYLQQVFYALLAKFINQNTLILAQQARKIRFYSKTKMRMVSMEIDWSKFLNMEALKTMLIQKNFFIVQNADAQFEENELLTNENYNTIINKNYTFFSLPFFKDWFDEYKQLIDQEKKLDEYKKSIKKKKKQFYFTIGAVIILLSTFILHKYRNKHIRSE